MSKLSSSVLTWSIFIYSVQISSCRDTEPVRMPRGSHFLDPIKYHFIHFTGYCFHQWLVYVYRTWKIGRLKNKYANRLKSVIKSNWIIKTKNFTDKESSTETKKLLIRFWRNCVYLWLYFEVVEITTTTTFVAFYICEKIEDSFSIWQIMGFFVGARKVSLLY